LTFKENVPDLRNSRSFDLIQRLKWLGHDVFGHDPIADVGQVEREHLVAVVDLDGRRYDLVIGAVAHSDYRELDDDKLLSLMAPGGTLADLKGIWRERVLDSDIDRWSL